MTNQACRPALPRGGAAQAGAGVQVEFVPATYEPGDCAECGQRLQNVWSCTDACPGKVFCGSHCISKYLARDSKWEPVK